MEEFLLNSEKPSSLVRWCLMGVLGSRVAFRGYEEEKIRIAWLYHLRGFEQLWGCAGIGEGLKRP